MHNSIVRVRFAPAPTGMMHLGNIRTALINALYAERYKGIMVLRVEDTDTQRNFDPGARHIIDDLAWLGLTFQEGPGIEGPCAPYFQSQRVDFYQKKLQELIDNGSVYRCFCTEVELDSKRKRQSALKLPPRYDRTCLHLTKEDIEQRRADNVPFIWRFLLDHTKTITITDLALKQISFELKHFSDFPVTRNDGSFTFIFANCVDDILMCITHVFRGNEHLSNTAVQAALYKAFNNQTPTYWHLPLLCNTNGKKLSKRDFGFSLRDLKEAGFAPEAILNYLTIIGTSYPDEIASFKELVAMVNLENPNKTGHITYDLEKFRWVNRKWIERYTPQELLNCCRPFLIKEYPNVQDYDDQKLISLLSLVKTEMNVFADVVPLLAYFFKEPDLSKITVQACIDEMHIPRVLDITKKIMPNIIDGALYTKTLKEEAQKSHTPLKALFWFIRLSLTGKTDGPAIYDLIGILGNQEAEKRITKVLDLFP